MKPAKISNDALYNKAFTGNVLKHLGDRSPYWLAKESGISQATVSRLMAGEVAPSLGSIIRIALALKVPPADLLALNGESVGGDKVQVEQVVTHQLAPEQLQSLKAAVADALASRFGESLSEPFFHSLLFGEKLGPIQDSVEDLDEVVRLCVKPTHLSGMILALRQFLTVSQSRRAVVLSVLFDTESIAARALKKSPVAQRLVELLKAT